MKVLFLLLRFLFLQAIHSKKSGDLAVSHKIMRIISSPAHCDVACVEKRRRACSSASVWVFQTTPQTILWIMIPGSHSNGLQLIDRQCRAVTASKVLIDNGFQVRRDGGSGEGGGGGGVWGVRVKMKRQVYMYVCAEGNELFNLRLMCMATASVCIHCDYKLIWFPNCWWGRGDCIWDMGGKRNGQTAQAFSCLWQETFD